MPNTYDAISSFSLSNTESSITFTNIPQHYTDLVLTYQPAASTGNPYPWYRFNGDTGNNYSRFTLWGASTGNSAANNLNESLLYPLQGTFIDTTFQCIFISHFNNYSNGKILKQVLSFNSAVASNRTEFSCGIWRSSNAISSILINGPFASGSVFGLYGIKTA